MILNLTQHPATPDQRAAGVVDLTGEALESLRTALTFGECPSEELVMDRATDIACLACQTVQTDYVTQAMIGGALWLMRPLADELRARGIDPVFAFSMRETIEVMRDGAAVKTTVFRHAGWVPA